MWLEKELQCWLQMQLRKAMKSSCSRGDEGTGPPPHSHDWDESFYVIKGNVEVSYGDKSLTATPGTLVHVPAGTIHSFRFAAGGGEMISVTSQTSRASYVFTTIDHEIPPGPLDINKLIAIARKCGVEMA
jgi:mannose-6-phosphate isomerase-like protein (cupin superfamily)